MRLSSTALRWLIIAVLLALWEIAPRAGWVAELFLPSLSSTIVAGVTDYQQYSREMMVTLYEIAIAMVFSCGGGIIAGAIIGSVARLRNLVLPLISTLYAIPLVSSIRCSWCGSGSGRPPRSLLQRSSDSFRRRCRRRLEFRPSIRNSLLQREAWARQPGKG